MLAFRRAGYSRSILALIIIIANVGAPFRWSAFGRVLLSDLSQPVATHSVVRIRALSQAPSVVGHRAVVGLRKGGPAVVSPLSTLSSPSAYLAGSTLRFARSSGERLVVRPNPPLRC